MRVVIALALLLAVSAAFESTLHPRLADEAPDQNLDIWESNLHDLTWHATYFEPHSRTRSIAFWIYPTQGPTGAWRQIFRRGGPTEAQPSTWHRNPGVWLHENTMNLHFRSATSAAGTANANFGVDTSAVPVGEWTHVVGVHGPSVGGLQTYINGAVDAFAAGDDPFNVTEPMRSVGAYDYYAQSTNFGVWIFGLTYWNEPLSQGEITALAALPSTERLHPTAWTYVSEGPYSTTNEAGMSVVTTADNPTSDPIHPWFDISLRFESQELIGATVNQDISDITGAGGVVDFAIWFYDDMNLNRRDDWVGLGAVPNAVNYDYTIGVYMPNAGTANYTYWESGTADWLKSDVPRTLGWHLFSFQRSGLGQAMIFKVDGQQIYSTTFNSNTVTTQTTIRGVINSVAWWSPFIAALDIESSESSLDFGQQNQLDGPTAAQTLTITNRGGSGNVLTITGLSFTGTHAAEFAIDNAPGLPLSIGPFESIDLDLTFDPSGEGARVATLEIASNDPDEGTLSIALAGQGGEGNQLLCEVSTATDPPTRFYRSSASDTCQASPTTANSCYYPEDKLATTFPTELRIVGPNAQAPLFADPVSRLANDGTDDRIYVAFNLPTKYYNHELVFADATNCGTWTLSDGFPTANTASLDNCYLTYEWSQVWADAYASDGSKCGWNRTVDGSDVELTLDFGIFAVEDVGDARGVAITRNVTFAHPMTVKFPTQVTAETANIQVFSPVRTLAAVVGQSVTVDESTDPDTATLTVTLSTEVQAPFELHGIVSNTVAPGITLVTTLNGANDVNVRQEAECTNGALDCANTWQFQYSTQTTTTPCNFNGGYSVDFAIRCSDESDTNCPIDDATDSVTVSFTLASSDHCPTVIDSIVLSAELKVYDAPQRVTDADDFVGDGLQDDGQTAVNEGDADQWQVAYFTAPTTSSQVAILETEFNQVWVERGAAADVTLLDKDNSLGGGAVACTATAYADADDTASCGTEAGLDDTTCQLVVPDVAFPDKCGAFDFAHRKGTSAAAGENSIPWFEFDINTGASGFNLANDAIETMTVHAVIDVSYANAAKMVAGAQSTTRRQHADVSASISAGQTTAASSSSSSATLFGMNAMVVYAGAAVVAIVAVAAIVVSSRRRSNNLTKLQSTTELTTTSTAV